MRKIAPLIRSLCAVSLFALSTAPLYAQSIPVGKLDPLAQVRATSLTGRSRVIVRGINPSVLFLLTTVIRQLGGVPGRQLPILDAVVADVPNASLRVLAGNPLVLRVAVDRAVRATNERTGLTVGSTSVRQELGYDGSGIGVAVIDSGITSWHDDLTRTGAPGTQRIDQFVDLVGGGFTPYDDYGHGTHVAGIIAGNGFDSGGARAGIAPGATLLVLKVLDGTGRGRISDVIAAFDYIVNHQSALHTRVVNLSIGAGIFESYDSDLLTLAAKKAVDRGMIVVASAGNAGRNSDGRDVYGGTTAPGNAPWVLTVGASSTQGTTLRDDDVVASFSSRGPSAIDRRAKPDLVAPGVGTESLSAPGSALFSSKSQDLVAGTVLTPAFPYLSLSGTSQAAPVVTGTVALMLQANPALTPNAVKAILQYTAQSYDGYDALTQGAGFLDARGAVNLARYFGSPDTTVYPAGTTWGRQLIWGNHRITGGRLTPTANAWGSDVAWGAAQRSDGTPVAWGIRCASADCSDTTADLWGATCASPDCSVVIWGDVASQNVVWGWACGGGDCNTVAPAVWAPAMMAPGWASSSSDEDTVVWGTADEEDTVVWGTADDGDTVVWGTTDEGDTVVWGTSDEGDTVVWGTSTADAVRWDGSCEEPQLLLVI
jgi:serine protease AprX